MAVGGRKSYGYVMPVEMVKAELKEALKPLLAPAVAGHAMSVIDRVLGRFHYLLLVSTDVESEEEAEKMARDTVRRKILGGSGWRPVLIRWLPWEEEGKV